MNLKRLREEKRITVEELSNHLGVSVSMIRKYENGDRVPNIKRVNQLLEVLECTYEELFKEES